MVVLGGGAISYDGGAPVPTIPFELPPWKLKKQQHTEDGLRDTLASREQAPPALTHSSVEREGNNFKVLNSF